MSQVPPSPQSWLLQNSTTVMNTSSSSPGSMYVPEHIRVSVEEEDEQHEFSTSITSTPRFLHRDSSTFNNSVECNGVVPEPTLDLLLGLSNELALLRADVAAIHHMLQEAHISPRPMSRWVRIRLTMLHSIFKVSILAGIFVLDHSYMGSLSDMYWLHFIQNPLSVVCSSIRILIS